VETVYTFPPSIRDQTTFYVFTVDALGKQEKAPDGKRKMPLYLDSDMVVAWSRPFDYEGWEYVYRH